MNFKTIYLTAYAVFVVSVAFLVNKEVKKEYMDEIFHVEMMNFTYWDPKITTFPGLYLYSVIYVCDIFNIQFDDLFLLRSLNIIFSVQTYLVMFNILKKLHGHIYADATLSFHAFSLVIFPIYFFFNFLFYTDLGSVYFTLSSFYYSLPGYDKEKGMKDLSMSNIIKSMIMGIIAILFRQNNIIWILFIIGNMILSTVDPLKINNFKLILNGIINKMSVIIEIIEVYIPLLISFIVFLIYNEGSVVLGDKTNHIPVFHPTQMLYFILFLSIPYYVQYLTNIKSLMNEFIHNGFGFVKNMLFVVVCCILSFIIIEKFTLIHPFLLADNRHYTFYIVKDILKKEWYHRFAPFVYGITTYVVVINMRKYMSVWQILGFFVCTFLCLSPAHLIEYLLTYSYNCYRFRYFIIPYFIVHLYSITKEKKNEVIMINIHMIVNIITIYLYLFKPFHWTENEDLQRFMW